MNKNYKKLLSSFVLILLISSICLCMYGCNNNTDIPEETNSQTDIQPSSPQNTTSTPAQTEAPIASPDETEGNGTEPVTSSTESSTQPQQATDPGLTENNTEPDVTTASTESPTEPSDKTPDATAEAYANYHKMSGEEQQKFIDSFGSVEAFFDWLKDAKKAYEDNRTPIDGFTPIIP